MFIKGFDELYKITEEGVVVSYTWGREKYLKPALTSSGYLTVLLYCKGIRSTHYVHRLVAQAFVPNPENKPEVNHLDGDKLNNNDWNLDWTTAKENTHHAIETGLRKSAKGELHGRSKLTEPFVADIRGSNLSCTILAKKYGVSRSTINAVRSGTMWRHLPGARAPRMYTRRPLN